MNTITKLVCSVIGLWILSCSPLKAQPLQLQAADVIAMTQQLEQRPLAQEADGLRQQLFDWTRESDAVMINVCDILGPIPSREHLPYANELLVQSFFGNAAFQLQHPNSKNDQFKTQLAGVSSMLRAYANIIKQDKQAHIPEYDHWLQLLQSGKLAAELRPEIAQKCMKQDDTQSNQFAFND
ncbi:hypothetical protein HR45_07850 [Shewanella mangrovi]|uniref:Uncharacterized protein n=1 Tax=Shewanella mangrovi TaxID=1515746 RepID=A0A094JEW7_9GAMM|nr:hypothetical protein [Shewanella mangrovi]KFZ37762.1 hypothetical protein HR45_07850 [Shewanella mangrovi]